MWSQARLVVSEGVQAALQAGRAVVALESTIITHGLPRPINFDTAVAVEDQVRAAGAEPATIAVLDGQAHIGLSRSQLERVADSPPERTVKASRGGLAHIMAKGRGWIGGTTVSGTMALAHRAGVRIFATGGIGGVHRGAEHSMDISADLTELGRTPVAVFCSGAKSILDIPRTLEYLETQGVPVLTFHPQGQFPCFYTAKSGCHVPIVSSTEEAARTIELNTTLGLENGLVFGVPIPSEFEQDGVIIQRAVEQAVQESVEQGIDRLGKQVTPWLLKRVSQLAHTSVRSNVGLVLNNARVASECAVELAGPSPSRVAQVYTPKPKVVVVGCAAMDVTAQQSTSAPGSTAPGNVVLSTGGVAHNIALAAHATLQEKKAVALVAPCADDAIGALLRSQMDDKAMRTDGLVSSSKSAVCNLVLDQEGDLLTGVADMACVEDTLTPDIVQQKLSELRPSVVGMDANLTPDTIAAIVRQCASDGVPVLYEPTSVVKCGRGMDALALLPRLHPLDMITPNQFEVRHMAARLQDVLPIHHAISSLQLEQMSRKLQLPQSLIYDALTLSKVTHTQFIKLGELGVLLVSHAEARTSLPNMIHVHARRLDPRKVINTTGAGDTFAGAVLARASTLSQPITSWTMQTMLDLVEKGQHAAQHTLYSSHAVAPHLPSWHT
ncbi:pseudouridylate synthase [Malassezia pachydermatis]